MTVDVKVVGESEMKTEHDKQEHEEQYHKSGGWEPSRPQSHVYDTSAF